jgi:CTP:phosphocholine cytidylyltransferase-like protein
MNIAIILAGVGSRLEKITTQTILKLLEKWFFRAYCRCI